MNYEGEVRHVQEGGGSYFGQAYEGVTTIMYHKEETTKSGYLTFDPGGMYTINWKTPVFQVSSSRRAPRGDPSSEPNNKPTGSSSISIPDNY